MDKAQLQALYRNRMTLPPEQRAEIERLYKVMLAQGSEQWYGDSSTGLDSADAAAVELPEDPDLTRANSGLYANLPPQAAPSQEAEEPAIPTANAGLYANLPSQEGRARSGLYANLPASPAQTAEQAPEDPAMERARSGLFANLPPISDQQPPQRRAAGAEFDQRARQAELMRRGMDAEMAAAVAAAEARTPRDPLSADPTPAGVRQAIKDEYARRAQQPAQISDRQRQFNAEVSESDRQMANIRRLIRAGVNPAQDMTAPSVEDDRKWREWATGGSLERMEQYAPDEYNRRWEAAAEGRRQDNAAERARRYSEDPETGKLVPNKDYIAQQKAADKERLMATLPQANRALVRQLAQMGIDPGQFGDWRSPGFEREAALDAKNRAMASGAVGGRYGAVQRRAQLEQNPAEYLGRPDITDSQRRTLAFLMSGGKGATANDVAAINAKMMLEGLNQGINLQRAMRIGDMDVKDRAISMQMEQQRLQAAQAEADRFYEKRRTWGGMLEPEAYDDLIAMLTGMGLSEAQAQGLARRYKRSGGRAERTAPPAK